MATPKVPYITDDLLKYLDHVYPNVLPTVVPTTEGMAALIGEQNVIKHLATLKKRQDLNQIKNKGEFHVFSS